MISLAEITETGKLFQLLMLKNKHFTFQLCSISVYGYNQLDIFNLDFFKLSNYFILFPVANFQSYFPFLDDTMKEQTAGRPSPRFPKKKNTCHTLTDRWKKIISDLIAKAHKRKFFSTYTGYFKRLSFLLLRNNHVIKFVLIRCFIVKGHS